VVFESRARWAFPLPRSGDVIIGRDDAADVRLQDPLVSRRHARLTICSGDLRLADLDSRNGTYVNGARLLGTGPVSPGDAIVLGSTFVFVQRFECVLEDPRTSEHSARCGLTATVESSRFLDVGPRTIVAGHPSVFRVFELIRCLAASDLPLLVCGETGTGKEIAASALHAWSPRREKPFVIFNCAAVPEPLFESQHKGMPVLQLSEGAEELLLAYDWPGNVRELRKLMAWLAVTLDNTTIEADRVRPHLLPAQGLQEKSRTLLAELRIRERERIVEALHASSHNETQAAKTLGISRRTLLRKLKLHGLAPGRSPA
jgi:transcriptional regulator with GAF, ATPase, and Fis domain